MHDDLSAFQFDQIQHGNRIRSQSLVADKGDSKIRWRRLLGNCARRQGEEEQQALHHGS